jgi:hypothetical protein
MCSLARLVTVCTIASVCSACAFGGGDGDGSANDCQFTFTKLCGLSFKGDTKYTGMTTIDTSVDANCTKIIGADSAGAPELCVISAASITIENAATVRGVGARALVMAASGPITVFGTLDVSSTRTVTGAGATSVMCTAFAGATTTNAAGGSGGAGASLGGKGGEGGASNDDVSPLPGGKPNPTTSAASLTFLRGGCRGQNGGGSAPFPQGGPAGAGGAGGGVVYLASSNMVRVEGQLGANGAGGGGGGAQAGGGGGGSGGVIVLEAPTVIHKGPISANGGGGGQGGRYDGMAFVGANGSDGITGAAPANGGTSLDAAGAGGSGGSGTTEGSPGEPNPDAAGGGGGGGGWIHLVSMKITGNGTISPPPT